MRTRRRTVLALRALGVGDLLTGLPALRALREAFPGHRVVLAAPASLAPLALHSTAVDAVLPVRPLGPVPARRPAVAVNLHCHGPESHQVLLDTAPVRLVAFRHPDVPESDDMPEWRASEPEAHRWCRLLSESGIPADPSRLELDPAGLPAVGALAGATVIHPGAGPAAWSWPVERWAAVAWHEAAAGRRVLITAGPGEESLAACVAVRSGLGTGAVWAGGDVLRLAGLVAGAGRVISGDTGVAHLATALGRPSVVLLGPGSTTGWGPAPGPRHLALSSGRRGDTHGDGPDPGLPEIETDMVVAALAALPS